MTAPPPVMPPRIARLPRDHAGRPVPYFAAWVDGTPDFRVIDRAKFTRCVRYRRCWVCGGQLGTISTFVVGPMCAVTRTSAEPPAHTECATYSVRVCPFLITPHMRRRDTGLPDDAEPLAGIMLRRNPGVAVVWSTRGDPYWYTDPSGGVLFNVGAPYSVSWWAHGRAATHDEVIASIESGLPTLADVAAADGDDAQADLDRRVAVALELAPQP